MNTARLRPRSALDMDKLTGSARVPGSWPLGPERTVACRAHTVSRAERGGRASEIDHTAIGRNPQPEMGHDVWALPPPPAPPHAPTRRHIPPDRYGA